MASNLVPRRTIDGKHTVVWRDPTPSEHALLTPIVEQLYEVIELLGVEPPNITDALVMCRHASTALQTALDARPEIYDDERREALRVIRSLTRQLNETGKLLRGAP